MMGRQASLIAWGACVLMGCGQSRSPCKIEESLPSARVEVRIEPGVFTGTVILKGKKAEDRPEVMILFQCNIHPEMKAYAGVLDHPFFAVTDDQGMFTLKGLPPGKFGIEAWQEDRGTRRSAVTHDPNRGAPLEIFYE